ncbi:MAG TPA: hypothetical protein VMW63_01825 [Methanoregulaceae archaeon]|nr:hypothetical protein [Methanoregulaceae archaeon]
MIKHREYNDYQVSAIVLLAASLLLLLAATVLNRSDLTSATLFLCGVASFMAGIFLLTFSKSDPVDTSIVSLLPVMGNINISRILSDLGVKGKAWFIPVEGSDYKIKEFIPVSEGIPNSISSDFSFIIDGSEPGIQVIPDAIPLLDLLVERHGYHTPGGENETFTAIKEISEDILEFCDSAEVTKDGDSVIIGIKGYRLYPGCRYVALESPKICTMHPCGICSLAACIMAEGLSIPIKIDYIGIDDATRSLRIIMTSGPAHQSTGEDPGNSG